MTHIEALQLIATPQRPDGTWNRDREACRKIAADALASMTTDPTAALKLARDARDLLAALLPMAEMQPADIEPGVHLMQGDCPDETQPSSRDSECPACRKMMAAQELIAAIDALPTSVEPAAQAAPAPQAPQPKG